MFINSTGVPTPVYHVQFKMANNSTPTNVEIFGSQNNEFGDSIL